MKKRNILVLILSLVVLLTACGGQVETSQPAVEAPAAPVVEVTEPVAETEPAPTMVPFMEEGKVLLDNEYITVTLDGEVEESYYAGYKLILENK